jgi:hypothetical protein
MSVSASSRSLGGTWFCATSGRTSRSSTCTAGSTSSSPAVIRGTGRDRNGRFPTVLGSSLRRAVAGCLRGDPQEGRNRHVVRMCIDARAVWLRPFRWNHRCLAGLDRRLWRSGLDGASSCHRSSGCDQLAVGKSITAEPHRPARLTAWKVRPTLLRDRRRRRARLSRLARYALTEHTFA